MISLYLPISDLEYLCSNTIFYFSLLYFLSSVWKVYCHIFTHHTGSAGQVSDQKTNGEKEAQANRGQTALDRHHSKEYSHTSVEIPARQGLAAVEPSLLCKRCRGINIESLSTDDGYEFYPTWKEVSSSAQSGCSFCKFLTQWRRGITTDGNLWPLGQFGFQQVSEEAKAMLKTIRPGRLYAMKIFEEGKALVAISEEETIFLHFNLSLGGENDGERSIRYGLPLRKQLSHTGSDDSFETARKWVHTCDVEHDCFPAHLVASSTRSPARRLIDLQAFSEPCLDAKLVDTSGIDDTSKYIALSYRWGGNRSFITEQETLNQRMSRIAFADIPLTFKHAFQTARELGVRYIWIDSICIIQDSKEDWYIESAKMCDIYGRSYVTLAADAGAHTNAGMFNEKNVGRDEGGFGTHIVLNVYDSDGQRSLLYVSEERQVPSNLESGMGPAYDAWDEEPDDPDMMLATRGWTLQEAILSPRVLHYTSKQLIWECPWRGYASEDGFSVALRCQRPTYTELKQALSIKEERAETGKTGSNAVVRSARNQADVLWAWYGELVTMRYSERKLSFVEDKLPAIAGLAALTAPALGNTPYIAGMWLTGIEWALSWRRQSPESSPPPPPQQQPICPPSFSWAASKVPVEWDFTHETFAPTLKINDFAIVLEDERSGSPFGRVIAGGCWIKVSGFVVRNVPVKPGSGMGIKLPTFGDMWCKIHKDYEWEIHQGFDPSGIDAEARDDAAEKSERVKDPSRVTLLELGLACGFKISQVGAVFDQQVEQQGMGDYVPWNIVMLVLEPVQGKPGCFTRKGVASIEYLPKKEKDVQERYRAGCHWDTLTIF